MFANKKPKQIPFLYRSETNMSIFNYIYRRPFSFSDPTQKIQSQQQQKTYQHYCHLNDLMIKSTWLPVRKKKGGGGKGGQWQARLYQNLSLGCCSHNAMSHASEVADRSIAVCIDASTPLQCDMRRAGWSHSFIWTTGSKYLLSHALCWRRERKGVVLRGSPEPFPSP